MRTTLNILFLTLPLFMLPACKKDSSSSVGPVLPAGPVLPFPENYVSMMGGVRYWHGTDTGSSVMPSTPPVVLIPPESIALSDTFALIVDTSELSVWLPGSGKITGYVGGAYFVYDSSLSDTSAKYLAFTIPPEGNVIYYYYQADSIVIHVAYNGLHGYEFIYLKTP